MSRRPKWLICCFYIYLHLLLYLSLSLAGAYPFGLWRLQDLMSLSQQLLGNPLTEHRSGDPLHHFQLCRAIFSCCAILAPLLLLQASLQAVHLLGCFKNRRFVGPFLGCQAKILDRAKSLAHFHFIFIYFF